MSPEGVTHLQSSKWFLIFFADIHLLTITRHIKGTTEFLKNVTRIQEKVGEMKEVKLLEADCCTVKCYVLALLKEVCKLVASKKIGYSEQKMVIVTQTFCSEQSLLLMHSNRRCISVFAGISLDFYFYFLQI